MTGPILLLLILLLAAGYGVFALARLVLRTAFPLKPRLAAYTAFALGVLFAAGMTLAAAGTLSGLRENAFSEGYDDAMRDAGSADAQARAELYSDAYTKGYADAVDGYLAERFSAAEPSGTPRTPDASDECAPLILLPDGDEDTPDGGEIPPERGMPGTDEDAPSAQTEPDEAPVKEKTGTIVYYTPSGSVLHFDPNCSYLKNADTVLSCDLADAPDRRHCSRCG